MQHQDTAPATTGPTILIIDDDADLCQLLVEVLSDEGYQAITVEPPAALLAARTLTPALILLDVFMPGVDSHALGQSLRADRATQAIPIVLVTGMPDFVLAPFQADGGTWGYLAKPFDLVDLVATVHAQLAQVTAAGHP
jgi:DNA-binding response OmpR family regulator